MRTAIVVMTAMALGSMGWVANAQEDQRRALAEELLDAMNMKEAAEKPFQLMKEQIEEARAAALKKDAAADANQLKMRGKMMDKMVEMMGQELSWDKMKDEYVSIYADTFTEDELKAALAFYKTPAGKSFAEKQPTLVEQTTKSNQKRMLGISQKIKAIQQEVMKEAASQPQELKQEAEKQEK